MGIFTGRVQGAGDLNGVRIARLEKHLTLEQVASLLPPLNGKKRSRTFIHRIETSQSARVGRDVAESLSQILDVDVDELFVGVRN